MTRTFSSLPFFLAFQDGSVLGLLLASSGVFVLFVLIEFYKLMSMLGMWYDVYDT